MGTPPAGAEGGGVQSLTLFEADCTFLYMSQDLDEITDPAELLDQIATLRQQRDELSATIREQSIRAVRELGANHSRTARAANISRVTLYAWLDK